MQNTIIAIFVFLINFSNMKSQVHSNCFEIKSFDEIKSILENENKSLLDFDYQLESLAGVYNLDNNKFIVLRGITGKHNGFLFNDEQCMEEMIAKDSFPDEHIIGKDIFEKNKEFLRNPDAATEHFLNEINSGLGFSFKEINHSNLIIMYNKIVANDIKIINSNDDTLIVGIAILFASFLKNEIKGDWGFKKVYGVYNSYLMPYLLNKKNNKVFNIDEVLSFIESRFDFNSALKAAKSGLGIIGNGKK